MTFFGDAGLFFETLLSLLILFVPHCDTYCTSYTAGCHARDFHWNEIVRAW